MPYCRQQLFGRGRIVRRTIVKELNKEKNSQSYLINENTDKTNVSFVMINQLGETF